MCFFIDLYLFIFNIGIQVFNAIVRILNVVKFIFFNWDRESFHRRPSRSESQTVRLG